MKLHEGLLMFAGMLLPGAKRLAELRARWAAPGDGTAWSASWYFDLLRKRLSPSAVVDDKTWSDLEFPRFFKTIDTAVTPIGRQCLFAQLSVYEYDRTALDDRYRGYDILRTHQDLRERIQLA